MARVYSEDAYSLGLLYVYQYSNKKQQMVLLDDLKTFHQAIESNLEKMVSKENNMYATVWYDNDESIYFTSSNKDGEIYYILKPRFDLERAKSMYIGCLSNDTLIASQMNNALSCLGLIKINGRIIPKRNVINKRNCNENCSNCDRNITEEMYENIISENEKYKNMSYDEAIKEIGFCEVHENIDIPRELGYWCPEYISHEIEVDESLEQGIVLKKMKKQL